MLFRLLRRLGFWCVRACVVFVYMRTNVRTYVCVYIGVPHARWCGGVASNYRTVLYIYGTCYTLRARTCVCTHQNILLTFTRVVAVAAMALPYNNSIRWLQNRRRHRHTHNTNIERGNNGGGTWRESTVASFSSTSPRPPHATTASRTKPFTTRHLLAERNTTVPPHRQLQRENINQF